MTITKEKRAEYETLLEYLGRATGTSLCRESAVLIRELLAIVDQQNEANPIGWPEAQRICDIPEIHEALSTFSHDSTEDNAVALICAALNAAGTFTQGRAAGLEEDRSVDCSGDPSCCPQNEGYGCHCKDVHQSIADERIIGHLLPCVPHLAQISIDGKRYCFSGVKELSGHPEMRAKAIPLYARAALSSLPSEEAQGDAS